MGGDKNNNKPRGEMMEANGWFIPSEFLSELSRKNLTQFIGLVEYGEKFIDITVRKDGINYDFEADFLKHMKPIHYIETTPQAQQ